LKTSPVNRDSEPKPANVQRADFGGVGGVRHSHGREASESASAAKNDEIQPSKLARLSHRDDHLPDVGVHLPQHASLQSALSDTREGQVADQARRRFEDEKGRLQAELNTAEQALAQLAKDRLASERETSKLTTRLDETRKQLDSVFATLAEERRRREQQVNQAQAQVAQLRARLAERDRDLSRALASGNRAAQEAALARRNFELTERALRVVIQLDEIVACTSPGIASDRTLPRSGRIRRLAKARTSFLAFERLRRAVETSGVFDPAWYRYQRPDVPSGQDLLDHFVFYGIREGTSPNPLIDVDWIAKSSGESPEVALRSYLLRSRRAELNPTPLFDVKYYRAVAGLRAGTDGLSHYLRHGRAAGLSPQPLFDRTFYLSQLPKSGRSTVDPFLHYVLCPFELDPHPLFSTEYYLGQHPELRMLGVSPLSHYLEYGFQEKTSPHQGFSGPAYLARYSDVAAAALNPLLHYVTFGKAEGRQIDPVK